MNAAEDVLDRETNKAVKSLSNIGKEATENGLAKATWSALIGLREIGLKCAEKKLDGIPLGKYFRGEKSRLNSATQEVLEALREIGVKAAEKKLVLDKGDAVVVNALVGL